MIRNNINIDLNRLEYKYKSTSHTNSSFKADVFGIHDDTEEIILYSELKS